MSKDRAGEAEIVQALESLSRSAAAKKPSAPAAAAPGRSPTPAEPRPAPPEPSQPVPPSPFRCLFDGYPLQEENGYRCSECGRQFGPQLLNRWFGGAEAARFELVIWLARVCVVMSAWMLGLALAGAGGQLVPGVGLALAGVWACWAAGAGKAGTVGQLYALGGLSASALLGLTALASWFKPEGWSLTGWLTTLAALLALLAMLHDSAPAVRLAPRWALRVFVALLICSPLVAVATNSFALSLRLTDAIGFARVDLAVIRLVQSVSDALSALGAWATVWIWLAATRRRVFKRL